MKNINKEEEESEEFKVYARIRPFLDKEKDSNSNISCIKSDSNTVILSDPNCIESYYKKDKHFSFDEVFNEDSENRNIFNKIIKKLVDKSLIGYNSTAMAYGVTGTGKTHTMFGDIRNKMENSSTQQAYYLNDLKEIIYNYENQEKENEILSKNNRNNNNDINQFGICIYAFDYLLKKIEILKAKEAREQNLNFPINIENKIRNKENKENKENNQNPLNIYNNSDNDLTTFSIKLTYLEIYNEQVIDLLASSNPTNFNNQNDKEKEKEKSEKERDKEKPDNLLILEDPIKGICIPDITQHKISNVDQVLNLIMLGNSKRTMASTSANQFSSRSHAILELNIEQINLRNETSLSSKLSLVDLAGSERGAVEKGARREEGANINKSLLALGNCINILSDKNKKNSFVPYRDSKLTRLLKDSLGGNISTIMVACISPNFSTFDETLNTLKYAQRARKIQKKIMINKNDNFNSDLNGYKEVIDNLRNEVKNLKQVISNQKILLTKNNLYKSNRTEKIQSWETTNPFNSEGGRTDDAFNSTKELNENDNDFTNTIENNEIINSNKLNENKEEDLITNEDLNSSKTDIKKNFEEKISDGIKFEKFLNRINKINYERFMLENFEMNLNNSINLEDPSKDKKYLSIKNYLENCFLVIIETLNDNYMENYKLNKELKKLQDSKTQSIENNNYNNNKRSIEYNSDSNNNNNQKDITSIKEKLEKNKAFKEKLITFVISFLSNVQYKGIIDQKKFIINQQRQIKDYKGEIAQLNSDIEKINSENQNKNHVLDSILGQLENLKNNNNNNNSKIPYNKKENKNSYAYIHKKGNFMRNSNPIFPKSRKSKSININMDSNYSYENKKNCYKKNKKISSRTVSLDLNMNRNSINSINKSHGKYTPLKYENFSESPYRQKFDMGNTITPSKLNYNNYNNFYSEDFSSLKINLTEDKNLNKNKILIVENLQSSNYKKQKKEDSLFLLESQNGNGQFGNFNINNLNNSKEKNKHFELKEKEKDKSIKNKLINYSHANTQNIANIINLPNTTSSKEKKESLKSRKEFLKTKKQINSILHYSNNRVKKFSGNSEGKMSINTINNNNKAKNLKNENINNCIYNYNREKEILKEIENLNSINNNNYKAININLDQKKFQSDSFLNNNIPERDFIFNKINEKNKEKDPKDKENKIKSVSQSCLTVNSNKNIPVVTAVLDDSFPIEDNINKLEDENLLFKNQKNKIFAEKPKNVIIDLEQKNSNENFNFNQNENENENFYLMNNISNFNENENESVNNDNNNDNEENNNSSYEKFNKFTAKKITLDLNYLTRSLKLETKTRTKNLSSKNASVSKKIKLGASIEIKNNKKIKTKSDKDIKNSLNLNSINRLSKVKQKNSNVNNNNGNKSTKGKNFIDTNNNNKNNYSLGKQMTKKALNNPNNSNNNNANNNNLNNNTKRKENKNILNNRINNMINSNSNCLTPIKNNNYIRTNSNNNNNELNYKSLQDFPNSNGNNKHINGKNSYHNNKNKKENLQKKENLNQESLDLINSPKLNNNNRNHNSRYSLFDEINNNNNEEMQKSPNFKTSNFSRLNSDGFNNNNNNHVNEFLNNLLSNKTNFLKKISSEEINFNNDNNDNDNKNNNNERERSNTKSQSKSKSKSNTKRNPNKSNNSDAINIQNAKLENLRKSNIKRDSNIILPNTNINNINNPFNINNEVNNIDNNNNNNANENLNLENEEFLSNSKNYLMQEINNQFNDYLDLKKSLNIISQKINENEANNINNNNLNNNNNINNNINKIEKKISCIDLNSNSLNSIKIPKNINNDNDSAKLSNSLMVSSVANFNENNINNSELDILQNILGLKSSLPSNTSSKKKFDLFNDNDDSNLSIFNNKKNNNIKGRKDSFKDKKKLRSGFNSPDKDIMKYFDKKILKDKDLNNNICHTDRTLTDRKLEISKKDSDQIFKDALNKMKVITTKDKKIKK